MAEMRCLAIKRYALMEEKTNKARKEVTKSEKTKRRKREVDDKGRKKKRRR